MKLASVTTALSSPIERPSVALVKLLTSSAIRWSGLSGGASVSWEKRLSSSW